MKLKVYRSSKFAVSLFLLLGLLHTTTAQRNTFSVEEVTHLNWGNNPQKVHYAQLPGFNFGVTSFEVIDNNRIAFLSNSSHEIIIADAQKNEISYRFTVKPFSRDFIYENGLFYVLKNYNVTIYNTQGETINSIDYSRDILGVVKITRFNNETYLILPSGKSVKIESNGNEVTSEETKGVITEKGNLVSSYISGTNTYTILFSNSEKRTIENTFTTNEKVAGIFFVGQTENTLIFDLQTYLSESPISVKRELIEISIGDGLQGLNTIDIPTMYFVSTKKDFEVTSQGNIYHMITAPKGVYVFKLNSSPNIQIGYPEYITSKEYHYNNHLIHVD